MKTGEKRGMGRGREERGFLFYWHLVTTEQTYPEDANAAIFHHLNTQGVDFEIHLSQSANITETPFS